MNLVAIANACAVECERQMVGIRELGFLLEAYSYMQQRAEYKEDLTVTVFEILGSFVEPGKNRHGFRKVPVTFQNGGSSCPASEIPRKMDDLVIEVQTKGAGNPEGYVDLYGHLVECQRITKEFLWIHPFADGNGRVGFLLWNYLMGTLDEPLALPDFGW